MSNADILNEDLDITKPELETIKDATSPKKNTLKKLKNDPTTADVYQIFTTTLFYDVDDMSLYFLYQPIVGVDAISIYKVLLSQVSANYHKVVSYEHDYLLALLGLNFDNFIVAKNKLESIGLISTYINTNASWSVGDKRCFYYVLNPPYTPKSFFDHFLLDQKLLLVLGEEHYTNTKNLFRRETPDWTTMKDVSKNFDESFEKFNLNVKNYKTMSNNDIVSREKIDLVGKFLYEINRHLEIVGSEHRIENKNHVQGLYNLMSEYNVNYLMIARAIKSLEIKGEKISKKNIEIEMLERMEIAKKIDMHGLNDYKNSLVNENIEIGSVQVKQEIEKNTSITTEDTQPKLHLDCLNNDFEEDSLDCCNLNDVFKTISYRDLYSKLFDVELTTSTKNSFNQLLTLITQEQLNWILAFNYIKQGYYNKKYTEVIAKSLQQRNSENFQSFLESTGIKSLKDLKKNLTSLHDLLNNEK
ncbi:hypothetical protein ASO20_02300 [Mycoplasma sp. (ex Biomphalaria glabrata)]|uniref:hypothetical protein n=1 Tax=Mycoplasma sp. (ex Biomphalaria glabrata) TaxID=1749074 RepID=UPI00073A7E4B|nr:hypothetical protein [Mycoplasma sp. (ex Biomphalaria glabrata)]ALV23468.1 hypothetical protein ASO20_02300 [Mycoplasma sp. (ex Biomphalaria glabrata)]